MSIADFFKGARRRGPQSGVPGLVHHDGGSKGASVSATEENLFSASMGFGFKCGVCEKRHKSSLLSRVRSIRPCIYEVVKAVGGETYRKGRKAWGDLDRSHGLSVKFLPNPEEADTVRFGYRATSAFDAVRPSTSAFAILHPKLDARCTAFAERINQLLDREYVEELSVKEALGAPKTVEYVKARRDAFEKRGEAEAEKLKKEQEALDPGLFETVAGWRKLKPESFKVKDIQRGHKELNKWFQNRPPEVGPIRRVKINGREVDADTVMGWFRTLIGSPAWDSLKTTGSVMKVLFDVALIDGFPAISWGIVGAKRVERRRSHEYKGLTIVNFVTTWDGKNYVNMAGGSGDFEARITSSLMQVVPHGEALVEESEA